MQILKARLENDELVGVVTLSSIMMIIWKAKLYHQRRKWKVMDVCVRVVGSDPELEIGLFNHSWEGRMVKI